MYTSLFRSSVKHMSCRFAWLSFSLRIYKAVSTDNQGDGFPRNKKPKHLKISNYYLLFPM